MIAESAYEFVSGTRRVPFSQVQANGARVATGFDALGVGEGDSVALFLRNDLAFIEAVLGAALLGAYAVPVNWHYAGDEAGYVFRDSGAKVILAHADLLPQIEGEVPEGVHLLVVETPEEIAASYALPPERSRVPANLHDYAAWRDGQAVWQEEARASRGGMIYTSGTTGRPKGVRRQPSDREAQLRGIKVGARSFGHRPGMSCLMTGPMYHSAPYAYARLFTQIGGRMVLMPRFEPEALLALIEAEQISHMHVVPTMFVRLLRLPEEVRRRYDLSSLQYVIHGAAPCPPEIKKQMIEWWGPVINEYYGSTEAGIVTTIGSEDWLKNPGSVGQPVQRGDVEIKIIDEEGNELGRNQEGEIYFGLGTYSDFTYHNADEKRREIGRGAMVTNGDVGYLDEDGWLFLSDRKRDMIISGGVNIYPAEIEAELIQHPGVQDCAVFGIPDDEFGEVVAAAVQPDGEIGEEDLRGFLRDRLAGYKVPRLIEFHAALPREDSGKIFKRKLRDVHWEKAGRRI